MEKYDKNIPDIPDANKKEIPKAVMSAEVKLERDVRRYIKKDGTFCKDFEQFFNRDTGKIDPAGRIIYEPTMTKAEAQKLITDLCEKSGRTVEVDSFTGRPKATPGWNLDIRVPGMSQSEQKSPTVPEGVLREKLNNQLILDLKKQNEEMAAAIKKLTENKEEAEAPADDKATETDAGKGKGKGKRK